MLINSAVLTGITRNFRILFQSFFDNKTTFWEKVATKVVSGSSSEVYAWLMNIPQMKEWIGDREIKNLSAEGYTIVNKLFSSGIAVKRSDIEDDTIGVYRPAVGMLAEDAKQYPDTLVADLLKKGAANKCYDSLPFFSDSHKTGEGKAQINCSNKVAKKLTPESYGEARAAMMSLQNDEGKSLRILPNLLIVPPALEGMARKILLMQQIDASDNIHYHSAELLVLPELAGMDTSWFLLDVTKPIKPFIVQERRPVEFTAMDKPDDESVFMRDEFRYGASWRGNVGYTLWQLAYMSTGTTA